MGIQIYEGKEADPAVLIASNENRERNQTESVVASSNLHKLNSINRTQSGGCRPLWPVLSSHVPVGGCGGYLVTEEEATVPQPIDPPS
jgi:hypothetical protein